MERRRERRQTGMTIERLNGLEKIKELKNSNKSRLEQYIEVK